MDASKVRCLSDHFDKDKGWIEGWVCPKCGRVFSPYTLSCPYCDPHTPRAGVVCENCKTKIFEPLKSNNNEIRC